MLEVLSIPKQGAVSIGFYASSFRIPSLQVCKLG